MQWRYLRSGAAIALVALALGVSVRTIACADSQDPVYAPAVSGSVVRFSLAGVEPDLDPIDRMIISVTLRDTRPPGHALPTGTLILSTYLENFQPQTTPILPDLLNQQRVATNLGGFLQGKAALVTRAGQVAYRGSVLAETFLDNQVRMIVDLQRVGASLSEQDVRLAGALTMRKGLTLVGALHALAPLTAAQIAPLRAAPGRSMSWQEVVAGMAVRFPRMMGTGGANAATPTPQQQQPSLTAVADLSAAPMYRTAGKAAAARPGGGPATFPVVDSGAATFTGGIVLIVLALTWGGVGGRPWRRFVRQRRAPGSVPPNTTLSD
ncbi:MAG: hypothetical protein LC769_00195 [Chloroflexi bacterium]|nr:hypothetical protein [Chloroflexota bacterium]